MKPKVRKLVEWLARSSPLPESQNIWLQPRAE
jgi:hypothetical protein